MLFVAAFDAALRENWRRNGGGGRSDFLWVLDCPASEYPMPCNGTAEGHRTSAELNRMLSRVHVHGFRTRQVFWVLCIGFRTLLRLSSYKSKPRWVSLM